MIKRRGKCVGNGQGWWLGKWQMRVIGKYFHLFGPWQRKTCKSRLKFWVTRKKKSQNFKILNSQLFAEMEATFFS